MYKAQFIPLVNYGFRGGHTSTHAKTFQYPQGSLDDHTVYNYCHSIHIIRSYIYVYRQEELDDCNRKRYILCT